MTAQTPAYLKARFENGDVPVAADYEDVFDSYINVATSGVQSIVGGIVSTNFIQASELNAALVSASSVISSFVSAQTVNASFISASTVSAATVSAGVVNAATVSANNLYATNAFIVAANAVAVTAASLHVVSAMNYGALDVSALATTQAGALTVDSPLAFVIFASNNDNSVKLPTSVRGRVQRIINASTTSIKIFPAVSGRFLVTAVNASLTIQADRCATIYHQGNDRYGIQVG